MKRFIFIFLLTILIVQLFSAVQFDEKKFFPNVLIVCFDARAINSKIGEIDVTKNEKGQIQIGLRSFDLIAEKYDFIDIERMYWAKDQEWQSSRGAYLMNIFKITLRDNENITDALNELEKDPNLIWAEYDAIMTLYDQPQYIPSDPRLPEAWHIFNIQAPETWKYIVGDTTIVVAIVDSGVKWNHEDLRENIYINHAESSGMTINWETGVVSGGNGIDEDGNGYPDDLIGYSFYPPANNQSYQSYIGSNGKNDHGTHVAGCVANIGDNYIGTSGPAMYVKLLPIRGAPTNALSGGIVGGDFGILYAAHSGAHMVTCSFGGPHQQNRYNEVVDYALNLGTLVFAAAGNDNWCVDDPGQASYPSDCVNVVTVGSSNSQNNKADHSNYGSTINVMSPGVGILSSTYGSNNYNEIFDTYAAYNGTSMATPVAAAVGAMVKSVHPELTPLEIRERLMATCDPMDQMFGQYEGQLGAGRINMFRAVMEGLIPHVSVTDFEIEEVDGDGDGMPNLGELVSIRVTLENKLFWLDATGITASITCSMPGVEIVDGNLTFETIFNGFTRTSTNVATFRTEPNLNTLMIPLTLNFSSNQEATNRFPYSNTYTLNVELSMSRQNWPLELSAITPAAPRVANLDGTGDRFITVSGGIVHVVNANKEYNPGFPLSLGENTQTGIAIGKLIPDSDLQQIVIVTNSNTLKVISHTGDILNEKAMGGTVRLSPVIADLNNDGQNEIIIATQNQRLLVMNGSNLADWDGYPVTLTGGVITHMAVGDVNKDGIKNIVLNSSGSSGGTNVINPVTGQNLPGFPVSGNTYIGPSLVNMDDYGDLEIVISGLTTSNCPINVIKSNGNIIRSTTVASRVNTEIAIADVNADGEPNLVFGDNSGNLYVMDTSLNNLPNFPINIGLPFDASPVFGDLNNDGQLEIIFGDNDGRLHIVRSNGQYLPGYPRKVSQAAIKGSAWVGSMDDETQATIFMANAGGIMGLDPKANVTSTDIWNTFRGSNGNTANYHEVTGIVSDFDDPIPAFVNSLRQNYPNPFNPETTISYSLKADQNIRISIYNIKGQLVKNLINEVRPAGNHNVVWNGFDNNNQQVASGLYFYRMETADFVMTKKMLLLK